MITIQTRATLLFGSLLGLIGVNVTAESLGNLAQYPPTPKQLTITTSESKRLAIGATAAFK